MLSNLDEEAPESDHDGGLLQAESGKFQPPPKALQRRTTTVPGVGPLRALAYVLIIGTPTRFQRGKQIGTYVGMIPCEESSARKQHSPSLEFGSTRRFDQRDV